jgi:hypothetical protein
MRPNFPPQRTFVKTLFRVNELATFSKSNAMDSWLLRTNRGAALKAVDHGHGHTHVRNVIATPNEPSATKATQGQATTGSNHPHTLTRRHGDEEQAYHERKGRHFVP